MEHTVRVKLLGATAILALGIGASIITSTIVVSRAIDQRTKAQAKARQEITVKGSCRQRVKSDRAVWDIGVTGEAQSLEGAYSVLQASVDSVRAYLNKQGFMPNEIVLSPIETMTHYKRDAKGEPTREVASYTLSRSFTVTSERCGKVDAAAGEVTALIKDGVKVTSQRPQFYVTKLPDLRVQILGEASKDARIRAEEIVKNAGGQVGALRDAQMGVLQVTRPNSTETSGYGMYDTSTIEKDVTAVVTVTFGVE